MAKARLGGTFLIPAFDKVTTTADTNAASKAKIIHIKLFCYGLFDS